MPILSTTDTTVELRCAACGRERHVPIDQLKPHTREGSTVIELPPCACGAVEVLLPSSGKLEHPSPGSAGHIHQLRVNELGARVTNTPLDEHTLGELQRWLRSGSATETPSPASK